MDPLSAIRDTFFQECEEQLAELESGLLAIAEGGRDPERINAVFRAVHSVKGGAGAFGLEALVRFAHGFETVLDEMRSGALEPGDAVLKTLLRAADMLADQVSAARGGPAADEERSALIAAELADLGGASADGQDAEEFDIPFQAVAFDLDAFSDLEDGELGGGDDVFDLSALIGEPPQEVIPEDIDEPTAWVIRLKPHRDLYANANETGLLLRELRRLGETRVTLDASAVPTLDGLDPAEGYAAWSIDLVTQADEDTVREVFEFVEGHCDLVIRRTGDLQLTAAELEPLPLADPANLAELDVAALIRQAQAAVHELLGERETRAAAAAPPEPAPVPAQPALAEPQATVPTIRVDLDRVDKLVDLVGELVITQAVLAQRVAQCGLARRPEVAMGLDDLEQLTRELQDSVMAIRAQPVKSVFQRMPRLARETAAAVGKQARLVIEGESAEVDRTVIERLADPITHMIRNAIDHGLESPERRLAAGKPAEGLVKLAAFHRSGRIIIQVSDDGGGIDRARVREIAVSKGLIGADALLSDEETDNLIFLPGFSTAPTVSGISGRGVGMDVVRRSIAGLGGRIATASMPGKGSTFTLSLPLTLAVLDGMVVSVAGQTLVAPLGSVVETLQPKAADIRPIGPDAWVMAIRGVYVPLIDVGLMLGYRSEPAAPADCVALLVEEDGRRAALLVDDIQGQRQVVIKSLEANYRHVDGIAAATILGDGRVALILDVVAVIARRACDLPPPAFAA